MTRIFLTHTEEAFEGYYGADALARLQALGEVRRNTSGAVLDARALIAAAQDVAIIVADRQTEAPAAVFAGLPNLVALVRGAVDIRTIDVAAASAAGVLVTRASAGFIDSVAELTLGFMIDLARGVSAATAAYQAGRVPPAPMGRQLAGATLGIIGYGQIGRRLAVLGQALAMRVLVHDPYAAIEDPALAAVGLEPLLEESDFVVVLATATPATENLIDAAALARMRRTAFLINVARGNLIDEAALERALSEERIAGLAMDVGRAPDQMPSPALARLPGVIATPHIGGLVPQAIAHQALETTRQVAAILQGELPPGAVNGAEAHRLAAFRSS